MLSRTLEDGLKAYSIGEKLRALRHERSMSLVELGEHTGLSAAMLSKVERGRLYPTLPTLLRIALVFSVGLEYFFSPDTKARRIALVRRTERMRFPDEPHGRDVMYHFESLNFAALERDFDVFHSDFEAVPEGKLRTHAHAGTEFVHVLQGKLEIVIDGECFVLERGDSIHFDSGLQHTYQRRGGSPCRALVVIKSR